MKGKSILFTLLLFILLGCNSSQNTEELKAYSSAKDYMLENLKAPSTADIHSIDESKITINGDYTCVELIVDAENSFGAKLRSTYTVLLNKKSDDKFDLMYLGKGDLETVLKRMDN